MSRVLSKNWIVSYSEEMAKVSEAPTHFHIWVGISLIGAVLKDKVFIHRGTYSINTNNYIVLVAPPGIGKSSAIKPGYDLVQELKLANTISGRITAAKIVEKIAQGFGGPAQINNGTVTTIKDSTAVIVSSELQTLLSSSEWMLAFLCQAWDEGKFDYDTKNNGTSTIKGMCTSLIGACVPNYIRKINKEGHDINDGFTARTIFVYADQPSKRIVWPEPLESTQAGKKFIADLKNDLKHIAGLRGTFTFDTSGKLEFEDFYKKITYSEDDSDVVKHFKSRIAVHVLKVAMIFSAADNDSLVITGADVLNAVTCLKHVLANLDKAFRSVGDSDLAEATARVQNLIERKYSISRTEILAAVYKNISPENLDRVLNVLCNVGFCSVRHIGAQAIYTLRVAPVVQAVPTKSKNPKQDLKTILGKKSPIANP